MMKDSILFILVSVFLPLVLFSQEETIFDRVKVNDIQGVKELVEEDPVIIQMTDENGRTPLHWAARGVHVEMMEYLISQGADVNARDKNHVTPLVSVVVRNHQAALQLLLENGASALIPEIEGDYPIHLAAMYGFTEEVRILLESSPDMELRNSYGRTPLIVACRESGDLGTVLYLLEQGADINAADKYGGTALSLAAWRGYEDIVDMLLERNAKVVANGDQGQMLMDYACNKDLYNFYLKLIEEGADIYSLEGKDRPVLHTAAMGGSVKIVRDLLSRSVKIEEQDIYGWTPLHYASCFGRDSVVLLLIDEGASFKALTPLEETPLFLAGSYGRKSTVDLLTSLGAVSTPMTSTNYEGPYFGQAPPGNMADVYAPGIVSRLKGGHSNITFSPDGKRTFWTEWNLTDKGYADGSRLLFSKEVNGKWIYPRVVLPKADCPFIPVDGSRVYFRATLAPAVTGDAIDGIWYYDLDDTAFHSPKLVEIDVGKYGLYWQFTMDRQGNLYSGSSSGMVRSLFIDGKYQEPEVLCEALHEDYTGGSPFIAPDGSYILFNSGDLQENYGSSDIYIGFKTANGTWSAPVNLGKGVNTAAQDILPMVSPDGKYLFYISGFGRIMWVDAGIIERKRKESNKDQ